MKPNAANLFCEPDYGTLRIPYADTLDVLVGGSHVYGEIYVPGAVYDAPHPAVVLVHGFPGIVSSDDLAQALRRAGFVVLRGNHRGAWNSEGDYSFTNCLEDVCAIAEYARGEGAQAYGIDPERIFLVGHSMGGQTVLNATRQLPFIRGTVMMAPYDMAAAFASGEQQSLKDMIASSDGKLLRIKTEADQERVFQNAVEHYAQTAFLNAVKDMQDRSLLLIGGTLDRVAPVEQMIEPLFSALEALPTTASHRKIYYPSEHGFCNRRLQLAQDIGAWLVSLL